MWLNFVAKANVAKFVHQKETWLRLCGKSKCGSNYAATGNVTHVMQETLMWLRLCKKSKCGPGYEPTRHVGYFQTLATRNLGGALGNGAEKPT